MINHTGFVDTAENRPSKAASERRAGQLWHGRYLIARVRRVQKIKPQLRDAAKEANGLLFVRITVLNFENEYVISAISEINFMEIVHKMCQNFWKFYLEYYTLAFSERRRESPTKVHEK